LTEAKLPIFGVDFPQLGRDDKSRVARLALLGIEIRKHGRIDDGGHLIGRKLGFDGGGLPLRRL
jgi:hypothetical protein